MQNCLLLAAAVGIVVGGGAYLFRYQLLGIYTSDPAVIELGLIRMTTNAAPYFIYGLMDVFTGMLRGMGYSIVPMISTIVCICGLRLFFVLVIFPLIPSLLTLYISYPISWILTLTVNGILYFVYKRKLDRSVGLVP